MAEIIDIIFPIPSTSQRVVVNTGVEHVQTTMPIGITNEAFHNASSGTKFQKGDNFTILSAGYIFPEVFTVWKDINSTFPFLQLDLKMKGATSLKVFDITPLSIVSKCYTPFENFELALDVFVDTRLQPNQSDPADFLNENFSFISYPQPIEISMKNVPATYNGKTYLVSQFFKILHNFPMIP